MAGPLDGIRVLDLGRFIAAPFCAMLLADLGAEVIRVERSTGAEDRSFGLLSPSGDCYLFINQNRNKKAVSLNFEKNDRAREILKELVRQSDVVIENFGTEAAKAFDITYDDLKKVKPDIIFAHVSAFGAAGPYSHRIGFDAVIKAISGSMSITGPPGPPNRDPITYIDYGTAALTAVGVLAALHHRERTGQGQMVNTALLQTAVTYMSSTISAWETDKVYQKQAGNRSCWLGPCDLFQTKDGKWLFLAIVTNTIWKRFCQCIGREELTTDSRFHSELSRWEHRHILDAVVSDWVASQTAEEVVAAANKIPIPCGICHDQTEVAHEPQVQAQAMLTEVPCPNGRTTLVTSIPLQLSETSLKIGRSFPAIGEHNEEVYCGLLGYGLEDLARLKAEGVI